MSKQLHKIFMDKQVKLLLKSYLDKEIKINYILQIFKIKRRRFFELLAKYRKDPDSFSIQYERDASNYRIDREIEANIIKELQIEKDLIKAKDVPIKYYNYSYIKDLLEQKYSQKVSLPTIIDRAKKNRHIEQHSRITVRIGFMVKLFSPLSLFKRLSAVPKYSMGIFLGFPSILRGSQIDQYALPIDFLDDKKAMGSTSRLVQ